MNDWSTENIALPASKAIHTEMASVLASAFYSDTTMISLLGQGHWQQIIKPYFLLQTGHASTAITVRNQQGLMGGLLAKSPGQSMSTWQAVSHAFRTRRLIGDQYSNTQKFAHAIGAKVPSSPHWYINQIGIKPAYQSKGVGRHLLASLLTVCGTDPVYVDCEKSVADFYISNGFSVVAALEPSGMTVLGINESFT